MERFEMPSAPISRRITVNAGIFSEFLRPNPCDIMKHSTVDPLVTMRPMFYILYHHLYNSWSIYRSEKNRA